jgi:hypothetical protein
MSYGRKTTLARWLATYTKGKTTPGTLVHTMIAGLYGRAGTAARAPSLHLPRGVHTSAAAQSPSLQHTHKRPSVRPHTQVRAQQAASMQGCGSNPISRPPASATPRPQSSSERSAMQPPHMAAPTLPTLHERQVVCNTRIRRMQPVGSYSRRTCLCFHSHSQREQRRMNRA